MMIQSTDLDALHRAFERFETVVNAGMSHRRSLKLWSDFVRMRDGGQCVRCGGNKRISAHHICRKSFMQIATFHTGNGITLCTDCHREVHLGFNRRPNLTLPMDAQGGEKIDTMEQLYGALLENAHLRGLLCDKFYFLGDEVLAKFKMFQGFDPDTPFEGSRLEQAYWIWRQCPPKMMAAIAEANGGVMPPVPFRPGVTIFDMSSGGCNVHLVGPGWRTDPE